MPRPASSSAVSEQGHWRLVLTRRVSSAAGEGVGAMAVAAGGAARAVLRRRRRTGGASASTCCTASGSASGGCRRTGSDGGSARAAGRRRRRRRERARHPRRRRRRCARSTTSAGTAARRSCRSTRTSTPPAPCAARRRCAARTTPGPTTSTAGCCARRTPRTSTTSTRPSSGCTRSRVDTWGGFLFLHLTPRWRAPPLRDALGAVPGPGRAATRSTRWSSARRLTYDVRGQLQGRAGELQRVLPLRRRAPGAGPAGAGVRPRRRRPRLGRRHPAPRGRLDVHRVRHVGPRAVRRARRRRAGAAQGRAGLPQPDAEPVGRPRRGVHAAGPPRPAAPGSCATCCSRPTRSRGTAFDPSDAADFWDLVNRQDWAICESVQRGMSSRGLHAGLVRADGGRSAWTSGAGCCPGSARTASSDRSTERVDVVVVGARRARAAPPPGSWPAAASPSSGWSSSSSGTSAAPRTTPRGSCAAATTRPAYVAAGRRGLRRLGRPGAASPASGSSR